MSNDNIIQIAVIDGNAQLRDMSVKQFTDAGFTVLFQADNGLQALERITSDGLPDVCIVEEDFATAKLLLEKHPDLKVLISSMDDNEKSVTDMLKAGVLGYVLKYADPDEIITAVKALNGERKYFSMGISGIAAEYFAEQ
ncbi:response regulator transcription factor [Olivibacter sp. XZL3]|uniref:response regulator n=1 Tax=Olivibacter sp. XZL3 TaxID=1735116 RepID=UPI001065A27E|nr:response regulator [Olivibacter sp. XZL3]